MGLSSTTNRVSYTGDGSSTIFSFPYYFFNDADLVVSLYSPTIASSIVTAQALNTNYTISGNKNSQGVYPSGANVVMTSSMPSSVQIVITRSPSQVQNFVLNQNGQVNSVALTQQFDYLTALVQRLQDEVGRCIHLPDGLGGTFDQTLPQTILLASSASAPLVLNSGNTGWSFGVVATGASGSISYAGILPVINGGTGQAGGLTTNGLWYSVDPNTMGQTGAGATNQVLLGVNSSAPVFGRLPLINASGVLSVSSGGTGTGTSYISFGVLFASSATQIANTAAGGQDQILIGQAGVAPIFGQANLASGSSVTGTLKIVNGGTGVASLTSNNVMLGGSSIGFVAPGGNGNVLTSTGSSWVSQALAAVVNRVMTLQTITSSSGTYTTPTTPAPIYLKVRMVGGGGGGGAGSGGGSNGGDGGPTIFGSSILFAHGGKGGATAGSQVALTGSSTVGSSMVDLGSFTGMGGTVTFTGSAALFPQMFGGHTPFGNSPQPQSSGAGASVNSSAPNTGVGGVGGLTLAGGTGQGGQAGGYVYAFVPSPQATYIYKIGASGTGGTFVGGPGGSGGTGVIVVEEYYQ